MWFKRARKESLQDAFFEAIQVERDMFCLKENSDIASEQAFASRWKSDTSPKPATTSQDPFNMSEAKKLLQIMFKEMVYLKKQAMKSNQTIGDSIGHLLGGLTNLFRIHHLQIPARDSPQKRSFLS